MPASLPRAFATLAATLLIAWALPGCAEDSAPGTARDAGQHAGRTVVVWISIDGFRPDYLERVPTPTLDRLIREGAYSLSHEPVFPSLTFPSHVSMVTGVTPGVHGIPGNSYYDTVDGETRRYPPEAALLDAEAIWITAERQGVRTGVKDWPVSHAQTGDVRASHFGTGYVGSLSDDVRLRQVIDVWSNDTDEPPLQLLMGYAVATDRPGHRYGPDAPEMDDAIAETDALLQRFLDQVMTVWNEKHGPQDTLYIVITSDHGMSEVHSMVNPFHLLGVDGRRDVTIVNSGNVANVFLDKIEPESARQAMVRHMTLAAAEHDFAQTYPRGATPERWGFEHPTRTGDLIVVLDKGYTFSGRVRDAVVGDVHEHDGPLGMHGYDPATNPEMNTIALFWRYPKPLGGVDLGHTHALQLHPTIARLLNIDPAPKATAAPIELEVGVGVGAY